MATTSPGNDAMTLANIIDNRGKKYRSQKLNVVMEPAWHDNSCPNADQYHANGEPFAVKERYGLSLVEAIVWANIFETPMTLYLYDEDVDPMGTNPAHVGPRVRAAVRRGLDTATALEAVNDCLEGQLVLKGRRLTMEHVLSELSNGHSVKSFSEEYDVEPELVKKALEELADMLSESLTRPVRS